ncbi:ras-related protein rab-7l1 [Plakobranchus ocellatus]|uniref:Ras-related protein rab-7l1 n=1 Tax=Plakobranchus ocellatus TaxID=259542 RepID=A0AAV4AIS4_9GAST|nr:ras-related protein rab-7l1 [Plakobranchus ocellatus]
MDALEDEVVKILLIGDAMVGKTSFIDRYVNDDFTDKYKCTIGCDFTSKTVLRPGSWRSYLKLQFWDIAGQERFPLLTRAYYRYVRGCIVMFDITKPDSFQSARKWKSSLDNNTRTDSGHTVPCLLVANKADLPDHAVTYKEVDDLCQECMFSQWTMTSVKDGTMVQETVGYLLDVILKRSSEVYMPSEFDLMDRDFIQLHAEESDKRSSQGQKLDNVVSCCASSRWSGFRI